MSPVLQIKECNKLEALLYLASTLLQLLSIFRIFGSHGQHVATLRRHFTFKKKGTFEGNRRTKIVEFHPLP